MKHLIISLVFFGSLAHAFTVTGGSDTSKGPVTTDQAEADARDIAQKRCGTTPLLQLSMWIYNFKMVQRTESYLATTEFACYDAAICGTSYNEFMARQGEADRAQTEWNYAQDVCAESPNQSQCYAGLQRNLNTANAELAITRAAFLDCTNSN